MSAEEPPLRPRSWLPLELVLSVPVSLLGPGFLFWLIGREQGLHPLWLLALLSFALLHIATAFVLVVEAFYHLRARTPDEDERRHARRRRVVGARALAVWIAAGLLLPWMPVGGGPLSFDAGRWQRDEPPPLLSGAASTSRQRMAGDLVENVLPGKTRAEVLELLGPAHAPDFDPQRLTWRVGIAFKGELVLAVRFDADDRVAEILTPP